MSDSCYFRAGAGSVIYNDVGKIVIFKRAAHPVGVWQMQQGGIDSGEAVEATLWRELREEVGLTEDDFDTVTQYPSWIAYEFGEGVTKNPSNPNPDRLGQCHRWWFLKLKNDVTVDLTKATDKEFSDYRWVDFDELIALTNELKQPVYQTLADYFATHIVART